MEQESNSNGQQDNQSSVMTGSENIGPSQMSNCGTNYGVYRPGITTQEVIQYYNEWTDYHEDLSPDVYKGPIYAAQFLDKHLTANSHHLKILDVGAGSGRVGSELHKLGYTNIDGLEPAEKLAQTMPYKDVYRNIIVECLGEGETSVADDSYDSIVLSGAMGEGHIPCRGLDQMIRVVKPGGIVVLVMREEYITNVQEYIDRLEPYMAELEQKGKWRKMERITVKNYSFNKTGIVFVFQIQEKGFEEFESSVLK